MHLVFKCAERWGIIELGKNPVSLVRVKNASKRLKRPRVLDVDEFFEILKHLGEPYHTMVLVAQCLGLRVSEILGLQWGDFDFEGRTVLVQHSVVGGRVDEVKTEYSKDDVPLDPRLAEVLLHWRSVSIFPEESDWVFANPVTGRPYHDERLWARHDGNQTPRKQSGCRTGVRRKLAGFNRYCGHYDRTVNCSRT